ncbi:MAG: dTDP-4-amino-4,6-dideoxygalactose transaminase [Lentisphaeria bacterium]|nr:dTDP-4-amino-4,6-dideoxygalactose transaminase [Lentisphaeria bacterium]
MEIGFNKPCIAGRELEYIVQAVENCQLSGDGPFTARCSRLLETSLGAEKILLTHSCTAALEMAALLCDIQPGDEVIVPSYTFVSTVNAFVLRGGVPVFADIRQDTLNMDESLVESLITPRTKAIVPVHYAGVGCNMDVLNAIAERHGLLVVEDAAQGVGAKYKGKALGTIGHLGCYSFHETKNIISGEGGALAVNFPAFRDRAEILREKGTNRSAFFRGMVDKYTWVDTGSSYLPGELVAAFLYGQLEKADTILQKRLTVWQNYHALLEDLECSGRIRRPVIPEECEHNGHMYYILTSGLEERSRLIDFLRERGIQAVFHYVPLHKSPKGRELAGELALPVTEKMADRLLRLPCYNTLTLAEQEAVSGALHAFYGA